MKTKKILSRIFLGIFCVSGISATALTLTSCQDTKTNVTTEYTVTFNTQGGSNVGSIKVSDGQKATKPANPSRDGYIFKYWSLEANGAEYNFDTAVTGNLTLYAVWEKGQEAVTTYTVTFVTGEGASTVAPATVNANNFLYWSTSEGGSEFNFDTPITANTTLYAVWEEKTQAVTTYTVTFVTGEGASTVAPATVIISYIGQLQKVVQNLISIHLLLLIQLYMLFGKKLFMRKLLEL